MPGSRRVSNEQGSGSEMIASLPNFILVVAPPILLGTTAVMFKWLSARFGPVRGYLGGFLFYWIGWCLCLPLSLLGTDGFLRLFQPAQPPFGSPGWLGIALLLGPVVVPFLTVFPAAIRGASRSAVLYTLLFALANGIMEEVLWRGTYVSIFPNDWWWGYLYPAIWFGLWHLAPQTVYPFKGPGGAIGFALIAVFLGLSFGWVALQTGSILWTAAAHVLNNFSSVGGRTFTGEEGPSGRAGEPGKADG